MLINNVLFRSLKETLQDESKNLFGAGGVQQGQSYKSSLSMFIHRKQNNTQTRSERLVDFMVTFMEPAFALPEDEIIKQGD